MEMCQLTTPPPRIGAEVPYGTLVTPPDQCKEFVTA